MLLVSLLAAFLCVPAFAVTEAEVEAQVAASSKSEVAGNVLIWFLCAVAFLKVSQKIDSFMATLGVNVGRTGGSLLAEAMIAMRAVTMVVGGKGGANRGGTAPGGNSGASGGSGMAGFFKGGLIGMASRHVTNSAVKTATSQTSAVHTAQSSVRQAAAATASAASAPEGPSGTGASVSNNIHTGGVDIHAGGSTVAGAPQQEGVIMTDTSPSPTITQGDGQVSAADQAGGTTLNIPPVDSSIPDGSIPDSSIPAEAAPIISQSESVAVAENVSVSDGGVSLNIPQGEGAASIGAGGGPAQKGVIVTGSDRQTNTQSTTDRQNVQKSSVVDRSHTVNNHSKPAQTGLPTLGGAIFSKSLAAGGSFANDIIGTVARGEVAGSITGDMAAQSLTSYMGYTAIRETARDVPVYSDVEIGRGRITGVETTAGSTTGLPFAMYHVDQYAAPSGEFQKVFTADGTQWYKQYAQDSVERKPYMAKDDTVAYHEKIVKKMPDPPRRKDRM